MYSTRVPCDNAEVKALFRNIFQRDVEYRASAAECLKLAFFKKHNIPNALPMQTFTQLSFTETKGTYNYLDGIFYGFIYENVILNTFLYFIQKLIFRSIQRFITQ